MLAPDGRAVSSATDRTIRRWSVVKPAVTLPALADGVVTSASFSPDGRSVVTGGVAQRSDQDAPRRIAEVFDARTGRRRVSLAERPAHSGDYVAWNRATISPDGRLVAAASDSGAARIWDWRSHRDPVVLAHGKRWVGDVAFSPDGKVVATTTLDRGVYVWAWRDHELLKRLTPLPATAEFPGKVDIAPSGDVVAVSEGTAVRIWDWRANRVRALLRLPANANDVSFDRTGRLVVVAADDGVARVYDWKRRSTLAELRAGTAVLTAAFSPDGVLLVTGDGEVATVWDWRLEQPIRDVGEAPANPGETTNAGVMDASFSPDASRIVTAGADGRAHIYSCEACAPLGELLDAVGQGPRKLSAGERRRYLHEGG